jgi:hypothetical protein
VRRLFPDPLDPVDPAEAAEAVVAGFLFLRYQPGSGR